MNFIQATPREVKVALQNQFPQIKFSVRKGTGTASHWMQIRATGERTPEVNEFLKRFDDTENDDIMTDLWCGSQYTSLSWA